MSDLLVRGGSVVDGSGGPAFRADVRVRAGRIAEIAPILEPRGETEIDARGGLVTPGFIDAHTHYDPAVFWDPECDPMPLHGVTSMVIGNCSLSLAPLPARHRDALVGAFGYIEDIPEVAFERGVPWSWESWAEYRDALDRRGTAVNLVGLVGHSALRMSVMGDEAWQRVATPAERDALAGLLEECLDAGGFGLSTSLADVDAQGRPVPSRRADDEEFVALVERLGRRGSGVVEFVPLIDSQQGRLDGVERIHGVCRGAGVRASWTGFVAGRPEATRELLDQARRTQAEAGGVFPQFSPRPPGARVCLDRTISFSFIPAWHKLVQADPDQKRRMLRDDWWRGKAREHWDRRTSPFFPNRASRYPDVELTDPEGRTSSFADRIEAHGGHPSDALADWLLDCDLDVGIRTRGRFDESQIAELLRDPALLVGSSDAGAHCQMFCGAGDSTLVLSRYVRDRRDLSMADAVRRLTSEVADHFGVRDRGRVEVGLAGDLVVLDLAELEWGEEELVADLPGGGERLRRPARGYRATVVGGVPTQLGGVPTDERPGRFLDPSSR
ncbi:MAG: amidohydrolase family protein [Proteobacteria bacterium]|nr:amidohydrolase family protein [Pseudomonadota bacterium]